MAYTEVSVNALDGVPRKINGLDNVLYVGASNSAWAIAMELDNPGKVYPTLASAIAAIPAGDGTTTFGYYNSQIIVGPGTYTSTATTVIPKTKAGITITFLPGAIMTTATALGANVAVLEVQAPYCVLNNPTITNTHATQTGTGLIIGGNAVGEGNGTGCIVNGGRIGGSTTATDFAKSVSIFGAADAQLNNVRVFGSTATTNGIEIAAGGDTDAVAALRVALNNCFVKIVTGGASTNPLTVAAGQLDGVINGGFYGTDSGATAIAITAEGWALMGGGLAVNTDTVGAGAQIDLITATTINIGQFYVKDIGAATAASLFDEANI